jgi:hypothetical protein
MERIESNRWSTYIDHGDGSATAIINTRSPWFWLNQLRWFLAENVAPATLDRVCLYADEMER